MRFAIFSDIHGNQNGLEHTLLDAAAQGVDQLVCLGDVGNERELLEELRDRGVCCTCGNWEVSGFRRLPADLEPWVAQWPVTVVHNTVTLEQVLFCHATPAMPDAAKTTADLAQLMRNGMRWNDLFPRLNRDEEAVWQALAALEERNTRVAFHGHTHVQQVWAWEPAAHGRRRLRSFTEPVEFALQATSSGAPARYLIGVGSAGAPQDGPQLRYAIYDDETSRVTLRRIAAA